MAIKYVIFDIDGVVVHGPRFSDKYTNEFGIGLEVMLEFFHGVFQDCLVGKAYLKDELDKVKGTWGWEGSVDELLEYWFAGVEKDERMVEVIGQLRANNIICIGLTNQEKHRTVYMQSQLGLGDIFDYFFSSADLGYKKPEEKCYEEVASRVSIASWSEVLMFDDDQENIDSANELGVEGHFYRDFEEFIETIRNNFDFIKLTD